MPNSNRQRLTVIALVLAWFSLAAIVRAQTAYTFTQIADSTFFRFSAAPSLNEAGKVAFRAMDPDGRTKIFSGRGRENSLSDYVTIATSKLDFGISAPGSYAGERVAFFAVLIPQRHTGGFFSSDGVSQQTIIKDTTISGESDLANNLMNRSGQIAYVGGVFGTERPGGIYVAQNGSSKAVYTIPTSTTRGKLEFQGGGGEDMQINTSGAIFFRGIFRTQAVHPGDPEPDLDGLLQGNSNGSTPTQLLRGGTDNSGARVRIDRFGANDKGQVVCVVTITDDVGPFSRLLKVTGGTATTLGDTRSGPFTFFGGPAINNNGAIVFYALFKDANGVTQAGLFTGPDPVHDKIIASGDPLLGSTLFKSFSFDRVGFNNAGQVAFLAILQNEKAAIVRADPNRAGAEVEWVGGTGESFAFSTNWKPVNGDPPRVPQKTDTRADTAKFISCVELPIDLGQQKVERLFINCGDVTFRNGDITAAALSDVVPSLEIDNGSLTLDRTTLKTSHAWIGNEFPGKLTVPAGSTWVSQGRVEVGRDGDGTLEIMDIVTSAESRIGNGAGKGRVIVKNSTSGSWATGDLAVGYDGRGELTITNSARVISDSAFIGFLPNSKGTVTVEGYSDITSSNLFVGGAGAGQLLVHNGGLVTVTNASRTSVLTIGHSSSGNGLVRLFADPTDPDSDHAYSALQADSIIIGDNGRGELSLETYAICLSIGLVIGKNANGGLVVNAYNGQFSAGYAGMLIVNNGSMSLGDNSATGTLEIRNNGIVVVDGNATMGKNSSLGRAIATVSGQGSTWSVRGNLDIGEEGPSTIELNDGGNLTVSGALTVRAHGRIQGNGTLNAPFRFGNSGYISPGLSPGRLVVNGNYEQTAEGRLKIEVGGTAPAVEHDQFVVNGNATLDGTLELRFINGFAPKQGDTFNFLQVSSNLNNGFATVEIKNLAPDFQFNTNTNGTNISVIALNDGVFVTPLQGQIQSSNVVTVGGISYLPYALSVTNDCSIVEPTGTVTRQGQELFQTLSERADPDCRGGSANVSRILPLGALSPGSYQFRFMSDGVVVYTVPFDVPADTGQVLTFTRTAGDELNLQINGLDSLLYTLQFSTDLTNWFDLPAHVGTFLGPYNVLEPLSAAQVRFYRVKIE